MWVARDETQWSSLARRLWQELKPGDWVGLQGELGVGKTSFVRCFLRVGGYQENVPSPSYPLMLEYQWEERHVVHLDAYRLVASLEPPWDESEWGDAFVFVEWPKHLKKEMKDFRFWLEFRFLDDKRPDEGRVVSLWKEGKELLGNSSP